MSMTATSSRTACQVRFKSGLPHLCLQRCLMSCGSSCELFSALSVPGPRDKVSRARASRGRASRDRASRDRSAPSLRLIASLLVYNFATAPSASGAARPQPVSEPYRAVQPERKVRSYLPSCLNALLW